MVAFDRATIYIIKVKRKQLFKENTMADYKCKKREQQESDTQVVIEAIINDIDNWEASLRDILEPVFMADDKLRDLWLEAIHEDEISRVE